MERKLKLPAVPNLKLGRKVVKEKYEEVSKIFFCHNAPKSSQYKHLPFLDCSSLN